MSSLTPVVPCHYTKMPEAMVWMVMGCLSVKEALLSHACVDRTHRAALNTYGLPCK
jgi:hypothetical protein